jgi:sulfoxide reductase heme-binding subunit YedZ
MILLTQFTTSVQAIQVVSQVVAAASTQASSDPTLWYITRAAGISAYALLALTAVLGLARSVLRAAHTNALGAIWLLDEVHPFVAVLAAAFIALHLVTLVFDPVVPFSVANLLLPIDEPYQPFATSLGVFGLYAIVIVLLSSWLRRALPYSFWRGLHFISFAAFALVTAHGILVGTDSGEPWMRIIYVVSAALVILLVLARLLARPQIVPSAV